MIGLIDAAAWLVTTLLAAAGLFYVSKVAASRIRR